MGKFKIKTIFTYIILSIWAIINLFPLYWLFTFSLKNNKEIFGGNIIGLPKEWMWSNYLKALTIGRVGRYFLNSVIVTGITILLTVIFAAMATYALTRLVWKGRKSANNIFMLGLTIPIHAAILPIFIVLSKLKMLSSYQALIIPYVGFALSMAILIFSGFMSGIPRSWMRLPALTDAGYMEYFLELYYLFLKPAISTVAIFTYLQAWNELMFAVVFIRDSNYKTLTVGIQSLEGTFSTEWGPIGAALVITTIPTLLLYAFMSKKIQQSLMAGAIKG